MTGNGLVMTLAVVFMALGWLVSRNRRTSVAEQWVMFLAGVFFWASGIGQALWVLVDGVFHAMGGR